MRLRRVSIENVRSFLDVSEIKLDGPISIIIGPNGGGKTNLLDTIHTLLRRHLLNSISLTPTSDERKPRRYNQQDFGRFTHLEFEKHSEGANRNQHVEVEIEISASDVANMQLMQADFDTIAQKLQPILTFELPQHPKSWKMSLMKPGAQVRYAWRPSGIEGDGTTVATQFLQYLNLFEMNNSLRNLAELSALQMSMIYLPTGRTINGFQGSVALSNYNDIEQKLGVDASTSRSTSNISGLAVGRLAQQHRHLEATGKDADRNFYNDKNIQNLSIALEKIGYRWKLHIADENTNKYDVVLEKQGRSFSISAASSGEREILTYLFAIHALHIRDTVILIDEPELHLHPQWQRSMLELFEDIAHSTGNQFILTTHSPSFVSPSSIQYVSRVATSAQRSTITRLDAPILKNRKQTFNLINAQNNEGLFFASHIILVEGISDRIFIDRVLGFVANKVGKKRPSSAEIIAVGGKFQFGAYRELLAACKVPTAVVADLDYLQQIGTPEIKQQFTLDVNKLKASTIDNPSSIDGATLVADIEQAMKTKNWDHAQRTWDYIKLRQTSKTRSLSTTEQEARTQFIDSKKLEYTFVLKQGALESYLPLGHSRKDINKLIDLTLRPDFWDQLPSSTRDEVESVGSALLDFMST